MEVIDLGLSDLDTISINIDDGPSSNSFGPGIELLMNEKKKTPTGSMNIDLGELDKLENELNSLSASASNGETKTLGGLGNSFSNFFGLGSSGSTKTINDPTSSSGPSGGEPSLGQATVDSMGNSKTWDGFSKINEIPQSYDSSSSKISDREKRRKKRMMIKKIEEWYEKGLIKNNPHFTLESAYEEVEDEYETALEDKRKKDSVKLQGWWFMTAVNSLEYANAAFNPFDINLDGWGEQVSEDIDSYEEIFAELHDKYKGGKLSPEISLILRLGFSAAVVNFSNKALSSATPAFNDVIKQSPELMKMFTNATVSSMSQASPGFAMANNLMKENQGPSKNMGPPPAPVETKAMPQMNQRPGNNTASFQQPPQNRPDISMGRGASMPMVNTLVPPPAPISGRSEQPNLVPSVRQEMRGPSTDIDSILSGLKTRIVPDPIQPPSVEIPASNATSTVNDILSEYGMDSMVSAGSMRDMQDGNIPKRTRRRNNNSRGNTVSLDL
jgi:hypothetical protein